MSQAAAASATPAPATLSRCDNEKVRAIWGQAPPGESDETLALWDVPLLRDCMLSRLTGAPIELCHADEDFVERFVIDTYLRDRLPVKNAMSLCCGFGKLDRTLAKLGVFEQLHGVDISEGAIAGARRFADDEGLDHLTYAVADLNVATFEPNSCDMIWADGAIHHIANLEHLMQQAHATLRPGGLLVCNEYVGPKFQQFSQRQVEVINAAIHLLPHRCRDAFESTFVPVAHRHGRWRRKAYDTFRTLTLRPIFADIETHAPNPQWSRAKTAAFRAYQTACRAARRVAGRARPYGQVFEQRSRYLRKVDPSEGVRSDEIIPVMRQTFDDVTVHNYGLGILPQVLNGKFLRTFDGNRPDDRKLFAMLAQIEQTLTELGEIGNDYALIVARK